MAETLMREPQSVSVETMKEEQMKINLRILIVESLMVNHLVTAAAAEAEAAAAAIENRVQIHQGKVAQALLRADQNRDRILPTLEKLDKEEVRQMTVIKR